MFSSFMDPALDSYDMDLENWREFLKRAGCFSEQQATELATRFINENYTYDLLEDLNHDDLEAMGVQDVNDRSRIISQMNSEKWLEFFMEIGLYDEKKSREIAAKFVSKNYDFKRLENMKMEDLKELDIPLEDKYEIMMKAINGHQDEDVNLIAHLGKMVKDTKEMNKSFGICFGVEDELENKLSVRKVKKNEESVFAPSTTFEDSLMKELEDNREILQRTISNLNILLRKSEKCLRYGTEKDSSIKIKAST